VDLEDNLTRDVTPKVAGNPYYIFSGPGASTHKLRILANGQDCQTDFFFNRPTFIVGQYVTFSSSWDQAPPAIDSETNKWDFGGNYKNDKTNAGPDTSYVYFPNPYRLTNAVVENNWWVSGGLNYPESYSVSLDKGLTFNNGQHVIISQGGSINMWRPKAEITASAGTVALDANYVPGGQPCSNPIFGLHCGIREDCGIPGISISNYTTLPGGFSGALEWDQIVIHTLIRYKDDSNQWWRWERTQARDNNQPVASNPFCDSPGNDIDPPTWGTTSFSRSDSFSTWLMFTPTGGHRVPLRKVAWAWNGEGSAPNWTLGTHSDPSPTISGYIEDYPYWITIVGAPPPYDPE
jgi:hypothetical protein